LWPGFLPDGRHFIYRAAAFDDNRSATYVGSLDAPGERIRLDGVTSAALYSSGYVLFVRDGSLVAQRFDPKGLRLHGTPVQVAPRVAFPAEDHGMTFSASDRVVSYIAPGAIKQLTWLDRSGRPIGSFEGATDLREPVLSPDGEQFLAVRSKPDVGNDVWVGSTASGETVRLSTGLPQSSVPAWSPDGQRIAFTSAGDLYWVPTGGGQATLIRKAPNGEQPLRLQDWSADGRYLVFYTFGPLTNADLWSLSLENGRAVPFRHGPANEGPARVSPDSQWVAYASDELGKWDETEVFVEPFPAGGVRLKVSEGGGGQPQWRADGKELFYLSLENDLIAVEVDPGPPLHFPQRRKLFHVALNERLRDVRSSFAVSRDGTRFLFSARPANATPITVRFNWTSALHN
jgi:dipeptidyl aminopeptidase/acylaminoacyl peptidase